MTTQPDFIKGMQLSRLFFSEAVQPILQQHFPGLEYSAGRLDFGSDVLGFDTPMSRDHHWGPRLMLFLSEDEVAEKRNPILRCLSRSLPLEIHGYPTHFSDLMSDGGKMQPVREGPVNPYISVVSPQRFFLGYTGLDITRPPAAADWLCVPWQRLSTLQAGQIFHDGLNRLQGLRSMLHWYPHDLWLYVLAAQWRSIDQEEPFMGRTADVGDELGSRVLTARLLQRLMTLCFLYEKRWPPYSKWFGTAFSKLECASALQPLFLRVTQGADWKTRETALSELYIHIGCIHNKAGITAFVQPEISSFYSRPYRVPHSARYVEALMAAVQSAEVRALPPDAGCIDQWVNNINVLDSIPWCRKLRSFYQAEADEQLPNPCPLVDPRSLPEEP